MKRLLFASTAAALAIAAPAGAQRNAEMPPRQNNNDAFTWSGQIPQGKWIRIRNLNGPITVGAATGDKVEVTATKSWRRGNPDVVRFDVQKFGQGQESVLICALWGERSTCDEREYEAHNTRNNDVRVDFHILVPKGVKIAVSTINGAVMVDGATTEVDASSINGEVEVNTASGPARASSINGRVIARIGKLPLDGDLSFSSINGNVIAEFTGDLNADIELLTVAGSLRTDYEVTLAGRLDPRRLRAHVGKPGGPRIRLSTVNGSVELRRR